MSYYRCQPNWFQWRNMKGMSHKSFQFTLMFQLQKQCDCQNLKSNPSTLLQIIQKSHIFFPQCFSLDGMPNPGFKCKMVSKAAVISKVDKLGTQHFSEVWLMQREMNYQGPTASGQPFRSILHNWVKFFLKDKYIFLIIWLFQ